MKKYSIDYQDKKINEIFLGKNPLSLSEEDLIRVFETQNQSNPVNYSQSISEDTVLAEFKECFDSLREDEVKNNYMKILEDFRSSKVQYSESIKVFFLTALMAFIVPFLGLSSAATVLSLIVITVFALWSLFKIVVTILKNYLITKKMTSEYNSKNFIFNFLNFFLFCLAPILNFFSIAVQNKYIEASLDIFALKKGYIPYSEFEEIKKEEDKNKKSWWQIWKK